MASKKEKTVFKKHKALDKVYHPESGLVIKSATDKVVIGRISDDEFVSLDDECLELCEKYGFKYDESLVAEPEENPEGEEKPEEDAEEEPEEEAKEEAELEPQPETKKKSKAKEVETKPETEEEPQPESKKKTKEDSKKGPEKPKPKGNDAMSELSSLVSSHSESLTTFVQTLLDRSNESQDKCAKLEAEIFTLKTQLDDTKAKMKKLLSAMQNDL